MSPPAWRTWSPLIVLLGLLAVLVAVVRRRRPRPTPVAPPDADRYVHTDDGVRLAVADDGDPAAPVTVVFVHGFTARLGEFDPQRPALRDVARIVLYDQRGHGRSDVGDLRHATIDRLGRDLATVLEQAVPPGPVVLVGHSMGGMTIMALADQRPELFGSRVVGACLLATSAGELVSVGLGGWGSAFVMRTGLLRLWLALLRLWAPLLERLRRRGTWLGAVWTRYYLFGTQDATPEAVREVQAMLEETPLPVFAAFYPSFVDHDKVEALAALRGIPVLVLVGSDDRLTPQTHSEVIVRHLGPDTEFLVVPGCGHSVNLTRPEVVNSALRRLVERATRTASPAA